MTVHQALANRLERASWPLSPSGELRAFQVSATAWFSPPPRTPVDLHPFLSYNSVFFMTLTVISLLKISDDQLKTKTSHHPQSLPLFVLFCWWHLYVNSFIPKTLGITHDTVSYLNSSFLGFGNYSSTTIFFLGFSYFHCLLALRNFLPNHAGISKKD